MSRIRLLLFLVLVSLISAACAANSQPTVTPRPTVTPFPTFAAQQPTLPPVFSGSATEDVAADTDPDPQLVERGRGRYEALECGSCHGENGEGTDDGSSLINLAYSQGEFIDFMRSGGELGAEHQYSTDRLSANGGTNLYLYLTTLTE